MGQQIADGLHPGDDSYRQQDTGDDADTQKAQKDITLIICKRCVDKPIGQEKQEQTVYGHGDLVDNILEQIHAGGIGYRDPGPVQIIDGRNAGTAAQSGCLIKRGVERVAEAIPVTILRMGLMYDQPGDMSLADMIEKYCEKQQKDHRGRDTGSSSFYNGLKEFLF